LFDVNLFTPENKKVISSYDVPKLVTSTALEVANTVPVGKESTPKAVACVSAYISA